MFLKEKLALFCIFLSHFWIFYGISLNFLKNNLIYKQTLTKIGVFQILILILISVFQIKFLNFVLLGSVIPIFCLFCSQFLIKNLRKSQFKRYFINFVNEMTLKIQLGWSFRQAFRDISSSEEGLFRHKLDRLYKSVVFLQQVRGDSYFTRLSRELKRVDRAQDSGLLALKTLQKRLKTEEKFRLKSSEVLRHLHFQVFILSVFYITLLVFIFHKLTWKHYQDLISASFFLFSFGLIGMFYLGRRFSWKV